MYGLIVNNVYTSESKYLKVIVIIIFYVYPSTSNLITKKYMQKKKTFALLEDNITSGIEAFLRTPHKRLAVKV